MSIIMNLKIRKWKKNGLILGDNVEIEKGCSLDPSFPWLITVGNNVTMAPEVRILAHDASMKYSNRATKLGKVTVGNNVFIGSKTVILPGVCIGDNVVIGALSVVTKDIPSNCVVCGSPARVVRTFEEFKLKNQEMINTAVHVEDIKLISKIEYQHKIDNELIKRRIGYIFSNKEQ